MNGLANSLNCASTVRQGDLSLVSATEFQAWISAIHLYPFVSVLEKADVPAREIRDARYGTQWQPFW
jgi:hypothetical protein